MSGEQKAKATGEQVKGKAEELAGRLTGDEEQTVEGRNDQAKGHLRSAKEKAKDALKS